ncbi:MAG TPA: helix-turn-helix transcriptional regulator [Steroidobacteraceae bacterium]|jgi:DNA-binding CsgD family transcriptional regulator|nr:helix-turn-helix transcriptional regulator [Steroidobacteraceae bacterium]
MSTESEWPFVERRKNDRRKGDRRRVDGLNSHNVAHLCTARERQTLALLLLGMTNKQIAQDLQIAEDTVKKHLQHIYRKVGVHRRALLMLEDRARRPSSAADTPAVE